ncbi:hypothetical protein FQ192_19840 [Pseudomonas sp. ANT_J12]|uniref:hypothetical protein n=1 Tax=Pseudomonas sp. ANT_J12 TaxID=2597351 RepID=UPI0011F3C521|nr:hypothetical protein [Pseudomonas sp. ANT_J12]KAA0987725.1 hypothetical protein FQ192_19840 [Pseudomonas sp. ANT_J12]
MNYLLENKSVLYIAPAFFGYESEIKKELEQQGANVTFLLDRPFNSPLLKALTRVRREWVIGAADRYYESQLTSIDTEFDYIFVVNGQTLSTHTLSAWRERYPAAKFVLYMWDSFSNRQQTLRNLKYFDSVFTFDKNDAEKYQANFRPLFFSAGFESVDLTPIQYDISFIGTAHTDRFSIVDKVDRQLGSSFRKYWYLFLQAKWVYWVYRFTNSAYRTAQSNNFKYQSIAKTEVQRVFNASKAILDIEHPQQTGLTMRTLETLGARKKLVTTNASVKLYDFYSEDNIFVIDRQDPVIPKAFLDKPYKAVEPHIYRRYSLAGWLEEIISLVNEK